MNLTNKQALQHIHDNPQTYLTKARVQGYLCPICGSGSGDSGTGLTTKDGVHFSCWAGCFTSKDIPDIIALKEGLQPGSREALQRAYEVYGINLDKRLPSTGNHNPQPAAAKPPAKQPEQPQQDYTAYYEECHKRIGETTYPQRQRGLTVTINGFSLGYDPAFPTQEDGKPATWKALIIPNGPYSFIARNTDPAASPGNRIRKRGASIPFNLKALEQEEKPVFIVEGEIDALSVLEAGGEAVGLGSVANVSGFLRRLDKDKLKKPLLLALDQDEAGQKAEAELMEGLKAKGILFLQANINGEYKDANEAFMKNTPAFVTAVYVTQKDIEEAQKQKQEAEKQEYRKNSAAAYIEQFQGLIAASIDTPYISTGFSGLDTALDGGFYEGLYLLGAMPSLGKTTFALQIADSVARKKHDVLIFSLEMARTELMAKSISRLTFIDSVIRAKANKKTEEEACTEAKKYAKSNRGITNGSRYKNYGPEEKETINRAIEAYKGYAGHIFISEGVGDISAEQMRQTIKEHIQATGQTPICIIDYTQIMQPENDRGNDKQNVDKAVRELKRISRDFKTPVIAISSFNRTNYKAAVDYESFKESGGLEYGSDVVMGLQLKGAGSDRFDTNANKGKEIRDIELKILKNRNGPTGGILGYKYYTIFNYFKEV